MFNRLFIVSILSRVEREQRTVAIRYSAYLNYIFLTPIFEFLNTEYLKIEERNKKKHSKLSCNGY